MALAPFLVSLQDVPPASALWRGYLCGFAFFASLLDWIPRVMEVYGGLPLPLAWLVLLLLVFYLATYVALFALLVAASSRRLGALSLVAFNDTGHLLALRPA